MRGHKGVPTRVVTLIPRSRCFCSGSESGKSATTELANNKRKYSIRDGRDGKMPVDALPSPNPESLEREDGTFKR